MPPPALASSCTLSPGHTPAGVAVGAALKGPPLMVMMTASVFEQVVAVEDAVKVNTVVVARFIVAGSSTRALTRSAAGLQL